MKKQHYISMILFATMCIIIMSFTNVKRTNQKSTEVNFNGATGSTSLPIPPNFKVAYYAFDASNAAKVPSPLTLVNFANEANVVVLFEGTAWEMADSLHYSKSNSFMFKNKYSSYTSILNDVRILQARGVKVLMNVDDTYLWNTPLPFTTYDGTKLNTQQFASFVKNCVIDNLHLDGIALDLEHLGVASATTDYINLIKEFGKYFGPQSSNISSTIYTAAISDGTRVSNDIGKSVSNASYFNFVMDISYYEDNNYRFNMWAKTIGASKTMVGLTMRFNSLSKAVTASEWQPQGGPKAGIMVFAANADSSYTNTIFRAVK